MKEINIFITRNEKKLFSNEIVFLTNCLRPGSPKTKLQLEEQWLMTSSTWKSKQTYFFKTAQVTISQFTLYGECN